MNIHFTAHPNVGYRPHWTATLQRCNLVTSVVWSVTTRSVRVTVTINPSLPDNLTSQSTYQDPGVYIRSGLPVFIVLLPCRFRATGIRSEVRSAAFGTLALVSDFLEALRNKVVSGGPRNPHAGLLGLSGNLALRGSPVRQTPCGRTPNHLPLPSVAGDSGLSASRMPPTGSLSVARPQSLIS